MVGWSDSCRVNAERGAREKEVAMSILRKLSMAIIFAVLGLATLNYQSAKAWTQWYVAPGGNNSWDCLSAVTACKTIQGAINKASSADTVRVEAGTYSTATNVESFPITINKSLTVAGVGSATTIVDASGSGQNVFSAGGTNIDVNIYGFTIQGGNRGLEYLGLLAGSVAGSISDNTITGNITGVYTSYSQAEISHNNISGNSGWGIYNSYSSPPIFRNIMGLNGSGGTNAAIYNDHSSPSIVNNVLGWNNGSGIFNTNSSPTITNNTISFNYGGSGIGDYDSSSPAITNNIITSNGVYGIHAQGGSSPTNSYNDVWANAWGEYFGTSGGTGSISKDPGFVSVFDAHLQCSSPAINAGSNTGAPSVDYDQNPRPVGGTVDMGAYEKQPPICTIYLPLIVR